MNISNDNSGITIFSAAYPIMFLERHEEYNLTNEEEIDVYW